MTPAGPRLLPGGCTLLAAALLLPAPALAGPPCARVLAHAVTSFLSAPGVPVAAAGCPDAPELVLVAAAAAVAGGRQDEARGLLARAEATHPGLAHLLAGVLAARRGDTPGARRRFTRALAAEPARARAALVALEARAGRGRQARWEAAQLVRKLGPTQAVEDLDASEAADLLAPPVEQAVARLDAGCAPCWRPVADLYAQCAMRRQGIPSRRRLAGAERVLRRVVELAPDGEEARVALGRALFYQDRHAEAVEVYRAGLARRPGWDLGRLLLGASLLELARAADALEHLEAVAPGGGSRVAWSKLGRARRALGRPDAGQAFARAARGEPPRPGDLAALGRELVAAGEWAEAARALEQALTLQPDDPATLYALSSAQRGLGDAPASETTLARYRRADAARQRGLEEGGRLISARAAAAEALAALAAGHEAEARARLPPWGEAARPPIQDLARAALAPPSGEPKATLHAVVDACRQANGWLEEVPR